MQVAEVAAPAPVAAPVAAPVVAAPTAPESVASTATTAPPAEAPVAQSSSGWGCGAALAYLQTHAAPDFTVVCPGDAQGHYATTCDNWPSVCPGQKLIIIAVPCPVAYMNEASNSLVFDGLSTAAIDPYGSDCKP